MLKHSLSILTAGLVGALAITACGDSGADGGAGGTGDTTSTATSGSTKTTGPGPSSSSSGGPASSSSGGPTTTTTTSSSSTTTATTVATTVASSSSTGAQAGVDGANCAMDAQCNGGLCLTEAATGLPGGLCTEDCTASGTCLDANSTCFNVGNGSLCLRNCDPAVMGSCGMPATLGCVDTNIMATPGACIPGCTADAQCTVAGNVCDEVSGACEAPENCNNGTDDNADGDVDCSDGQCFTDPMCAENCTNGMDDNGNGDIDCQDAICATDPACVPPAGWTCNPGFYNVNDGCDCECGAPDPDCNIAGSDIFGCGDEATNGATCSAAGQCVPGAAWTCGAALFVDQANCDCNCGVLDPDCNDATLPVAGCMAGQTCSAAGACVNSCGDGTCDWDPMSAPGGMSECGTCAADCATDAHCGACDATPATCDFADACTCDSCNMDAFCTDPGNCTDDGFCNQFIEGCQCADCTGVPNCQ